MLIGACQKAKSCYGPTEAVASTRKKGHGFWHFIAEAPSQDNRNEDDRTLDLARCARVRWVACRILQVYPDAPLEEEDRWPEYFAWLEQAALRMSEVFGPLIKALN